MNLDTLDRLRDLERESDDLDLKLGDLLAFIDSPTFNRISIGHRKLLKKQAKAMLEYQHILFARIYLFKREHEGGQ